jgi:DNA-binding NarL/FixJ family response regulator
MPITVSVVEDHDQTRATIMALLAKAAGLKCLHAYPTAEAALDGVPSHKPDVLLVDIRLPRMSGIQCVAELKTKIPDIKVLMLTTYEERDLIFNSLRAGASGYILKNALRAELIQAVEQVDAGGAPMSMPVARKLVGFFQTRAPAGSDLENLTQREQEILTLLARGYQYKEIAESAGVTLETVRSHIKHIYDKLHVRSRTEATLNFLGEAGTTAR